jgi:hypothetical protein
MKLFDGVSQTDYQDILRALGRFIDRNQYIGIRIIETEDGLIFQGRPSPSSGKVKPGAQIETYLITDADLQQLLHEAYAQRGQGEETFRRME